VIVLWVVTVLKEHHLDIAVCKVCVADAPGEVDIIDAGHNPRIAEGLVRANETIGVRVLDQVVHLVL
jgi:hypothetical protein